MPNSLQRRQTEENAQQESHWVDLGNPRAGSHQVAANMIPKQLRARCHLDAAHAPSPLRNARESESGSSSTYG